MSFTSCTKYQPGSDWKSNIPIHLNGIPLVKYWQEKYQITPLAEQDRLGLYPVGYDRTAIALTLMGY